MGKVFLISGMHRSGTSLFSNWINDCGIHLGKDFIQKDFANPTGFYEDKDFVDLHKGILIDNKVDHFTLTAELFISQKRTEQAKSLSKSRETNLIWGWKDPRSILFLDFWNSIIEDLNFIFLYRDALEVVNSLESRMIKNKDLFFKSKYYLLKRREHRAMYASSWMLNNALILEFVKKLPKEKYCLFNINSFKNNDRKVYAKINEKFKLNLEYKNLDQIIDPKLLKGNSGNFKFPAETKKKISILYDELSKYETNILD